MVLFEGAVWLKVLFFVDFHTFSWMPTPDFIQSKDDSIKLKSLIQSFLGEFLDEFSNVFNV